MALKGGQGRKRLTYGDSNSRKRARGAAVMQNRIAKLNSEA